MSCQPYIYRETTHHISIFFSNRGEYNVQRMSQTKAWKITIANILLLITNYRHEYVMCFEKKPLNDIQLLYYNSNELYLFSKSWSMVILISWWAALSYSVLLRQPFMSVIWSDLISEAVLVCSELIITVTSLNGRIVFCMASIISVSISLNSLRRSLFCKFYK